MTTHHPSTPSKNGVVLTRRMFLLAAGATTLAACSSKKTAETTDTTADTIDTTAADTTAGGSNSAETTKASANATSATDAASTGFNALWIPPLLKGPSFDLALAPSAAKLLDGSSAATIAYNGAPMWGPTLLMKKGEKVSLNVTNNLTEDTTAHWHGIHLPPEMDGGPHQTIAAGKTWSPTWTVKNNAATFWYHPHAHELTWKQLNQGAGGFIIVQDDEESALALPRTYGVDDIPVVFSSRKFDSTGQIDTTAIYGDYALANGVMNAEIKVPAQLVRFRILNAEVERAYTLGFSDERSFSVIATDGGLVEVPVKVTRLVMLPGERYEIVVDLGGDSVGASLAMQSLNGGYSLGYPGGEPNETGEFGSKLNNKTFDLLRLTVIATTDDAVKILPSTLVKNTLWTASDATNKRTINITDEGPGTPFTFDNKSYSMDTMNQTVKLNTVEAWTVTNDQVFGHSFHIHDVQFAIVDRSSGTIADYEKGWKDTCYIPVNESVTFVAKFDDYASTEHPFMYHCHMSNHEDEGLMGQFLVIP